MEKRNRSALALLAYCFTTTLAAAVVLAILLAGATFAAGPSLESSARNLNSISTSQAFSGVITDSHCCARHLQDSGKSPAECVRSCVRHGAKYVLVDGDANYVLAGNPGVFAGLAGQRARILGTLDGDVLTVTAATAQ
jgi:hypothetical protein